MNLGADKPEQEGTWVDAAGAFTGGVLDSLGYGAGGAPPAPKKNEMLPWIIGGSALLLGGVILFAVNK